MSVCPYCEREATVVLGSCSECGQSVTGRPSLVETQVRKAQERSYPTWRLRYYGQQERSYPVWRLRHWLRFPR